MLKCGALSLLLLSPSKAGREAEREADKDKAGISVSVLGGHRAIFRSGKGLSFDVSHDVRDQIDIREVPSDTLYAGTSLSRSERRAARLSLAVAQTASSAPSLSVSIPSSGGSDRERERQTEAERRRVLRSSAYPGVIDDDALRYLLASCNVQEGSGDSETPSLVRSLTLGTARLTHPASSMSGISGLMGPSLTSLTLCDAMDTETLIWALSLPRLTSLSLMLDGRCLMEPTALAAYDRRIRSLETLKTLTIGSYQSQFSPSETRQYSPSETRQVLAFVAHLLSLCPSLSVLHLVNFGFMTPQRVKAMIHGYVAHKRRSAPLHKGRPNKTIATRIVIACPGMDALYQSELGEPVMEVGGVCVVATSQ
ncbi:hypothetical protein KIPB_006447 [Kipferlia bialata]|uniref:Leucine-rich repeat domain, L domain-like n=1 Tax=Kipferlia bialata TaxID=797122 RepID=A0A9K3GI66_9EUKA|nr:hypothetical protein KIPB_006447 [Kipferlia bialata]|eukprot:g6447.t1